MTHSMKRIVTLVPYKSIIEDGPNYGKTAVGEMNDKTVSFMQNRFVVYRNFIPKELITFAMDTWKTIEHSPEYADAIFDNEREPIPRTPEQSLHTSRGAHTTPMGVAMHRWLYKKLQKEFDLQLWETYSYTRKYVRGGYLRAHSDRPSCEVSATICLDYLTDDNKPWSIWVDNSRNWVDIVNNDYSDDNSERIFEETQGVPIRKRDSVRIDLEVGDLLLYQGPNVIHWRDTLMGEYSYHMFLHYVTDASKMSGVEDTFIKKDIFSQHQRHILHYDGRKNPYGQIEEGNFFNPELQEQWRRRYDLMPNKGDFVNNYDHIKLEKIKE